MYIYWGLGTNSFLKNLKDKTNGLICYYKSKFIFIMMESTLKSFFKILLYMDPPATCVTNQGIMFLPLRQFLYIVYRDSQNITDHFLSSLILLLFSKSSKILYTLPKIRLGDCVGGGG